MIQCLACEDWFHESCLNLRERPSSRQPTPEVPQEPRVETDDAASETSSSGLPPPLIHASDYECLVCSACVRRIDVLRRWAGTPGVLMVVRNSPENRWRVIGKEDGAETDTVEIDTVGNEVESSPVTGEKRERSASAADAPEAKRTRVSPDASCSSPPCLAPPINQAAQDLLTYLDKMGLPETTPIVEHEYLGAGDIFLTSGWRDRWCIVRTVCPHCDRGHIFLRRKKPTNPLRTLILACRLKNWVCARPTSSPDRAIDGIRAFNEMRDDLMNHLRPFAQEGKEVTEADIRAFFDARMATK
ncbi:putative E3 ubiquitin-protein ligase UBR7 [Grifola frondosa]|uniref:Putative E3 ubiquitin-protein ligase UBR7 n=1 Tax=Grifola frondosa TaxID=5627 RepID=A0A1C7MLJ2_GRIFR|nr:putative E3 ubiquitin-protein ligase UBR7 [Grifola frondosa]